MPSAQSFRLAHRALPGRDLADVDLTTRLLGAQLAAPLVLTGDGGSAGELARAACEHGLGLLLGGGRGVPEDPIGAYRTRDRPPLLLAGAALGTL